MLQKKQEVPRHLLLHTPNWEAWSWVCTAVRETKQYVPVLGQQKRGERDNGIGLGLNRSVRARCSSMAHLVANIQMGNGRTWWEGAERHLRQPWLQKGWRSQWGFGPSLLRLSPCIRSRSREHRRFVLTVLTSLLPCLLPAPRLSYPILPCFLGCHHCCPGFS